MVVPGLKECPYRLLSLQKQSRVYFNVTLPPKNVYYPNTYHVGKHKNKEQIAKEKKKLAKQYKTFILQQQFKNNLITNKNTNILTSANVCQI